MRIIKLITSLMLVAMVLGVFATPVLAVTQDDINSVTQQIDDIASKKDTAHDMAESARELGLNEDSETIKTAKDIWLQCHSEQAVLANKLSAMREEFEQQNKKVYIGEFSLTAYCPCRQCCGKTDGITASGAKAIEGVTVAADTKVLPFGTRIYIENVGERVVQDVGGAIKKNRLDVFVSTHARAYSDPAYAQKNAKVWILK